MTSAPHGPAPHRPDRGAQAERTTLAWVRTALATAATAVLAARALQFRTSGLVLAVVALLGVTAFVLSALRGLHGHRTARMTGNPATALGSRPGAPVLVALAVAALCGAAAVLLVVDGPR